MQYRPLGRTGLKVASLCLGTMQFGWTCDEEIAHQIMDAYMEAGGNFIDTADVYSRWVEGNPGGVSEEIIGRWLKSRGNRESIVLATKVNGSMGPGPNDEGLSRKHIMAAVEASLRRLQVEYIDLSQAHFDHPSTPLEETLHAFDTLIQQGKVRYIGASNYTAWRLTRALWESERHGYARYDSLQPHYNLAHREEYERELAPLCLEQGIGVIPYSPLAGGFLTGKYRKSQELPASQRASRIQSSYMNEQGFALLDGIDQIAAAHKSTPAGVSLAWLLSRPGMTAPIIGANSVSQLQETIQAAEIHLQEVELDALEKASAWS